MIQVGIRQFSGNLNVDFFRKVGFNLLLGFLHGKFGLQVSFTVKLRSLNKTLVGSDIVGHLEHHTVSRDLLLIFEDEDVSNFDVFEAGLYNVLVAFGKGSNLLNFGSVYLVV